MQGFLNDEQIEHFLRFGFVALRGVFSREASEEWARDVWVRLGYDPTDPATWTRSRIHMPTLATVEIEAFAPDAWSAICQLCGGAERIQPGRWGDGFIVNLGAPEHARTWQPPTADAPGWHKDGDFFRHFLDSPEQGLLTIVLWSDVVPGGGATFLAADSVPPVARYLAAHPEGVVPGAFDFRGLIGQCSDFREATGAAGDVYLMHPFLLHASSENALRRPRLITNPPIHLREPMRLDRPGGDYSPVERAILRGLGVERMSFAPTAPRERIVPERERLQARMKEEERARLAEAQTERSGG